jgi:hypothetical protein
VLKDQGATPTGVRSRWIYRPKGKRKARRSSPRTHPCGIRIEIVSASLFLCSDFSGDELQGDENQAASSSGSANDYAAVPVTEVPCLCLTLSHNGASTADDFGLHF